MTQFETELIRAIEHGCPRCGRYLSKITENITIARKYPNKELVLHRGAYKYLTCTNGHPLWSNITGWIPELQEIVKGE